MKGRAKLVQLGKEIRTVADFGRAYKCISTGRGYFTLEDWLSFTETFSDLLLRHEDILHHQVRSYPSLAVMQPGSVLQIPAGIACSHGMQVRGNCRALPSLGGPQHLLAN